MPQHAEHLVLLQQPDNFDFSLSTFGDRQLGFNSKTLKSLPLYPGAKEFELCRMYNRLRKKEDCCKNHELQNEEASSD